MFNFKATLSDITVNFTPDEWPRIKKMIEFSLQEMEEQNATDLEKMKQYPSLTLEQIYRQERNPLLSK